VAYERTSVVKEVALLDQFVALGLTRHFRVCVVDKVKQELNVTFQNRQVDWNNQSFALELISTFLLVFVIYIIIYDSIIVTTKPLRHYLVRRK